MYWVLLCVTAFSVVNLQDVEGQEVGKWDKRVDPLVLAVVRKYLSECQGSFYSKDKQRCFTIYLLLSMTPLFVSSIKIISPPFHIPTPSPPLEREGLSHLPSLPHFFIFVLLF